MADEVSLVNWTPSLSQLIFALIDFPLHPSYSDLASEISASPNSQSTFPSLAMDSISLNADSWTGKLVFTEFDHKGSACIRSEWTHSCLKTDLLMGEICANNNITVIRFYKGKQEFRQKNHTKGKIN